MACILTSVGSPIKRLRSHLNLRFMDERTQRRRWEIPIVFQIIAFVVTHAHIPKSFQLLNYVIRQHVIFQCVVDVCVATTVWKIAFALTWWHACGVE